jgi:hypothetical protein
MPGQSYQLFPLESLGSSLGDGSLAHRLHNDFWPLVLLPHLPAMIRDALTLPELLRRRFQNGTDWPIFCSSGSVRVVHES